MKPSLSTFLLTAFIALPVEAVLIHWLWSSWVVSIVGVSLPWPQTFVIAFLASGFTQAVMLLEKIANMMHEQQEQQAAQDKKEEERRWDLPLA